MEQQTLTKSDYNEEPVFFCSKCLSLRIRGVENQEGTEFCDECGSTEILQDSITNWETLYEQRYGTKFLDMKKKRNNNTSII